MIGTCSTHETSSVRGHDALISRFDPESARVGAVVRSFYLFIA